ncbi:hypothetical protein BDF21DRAFT_406392 [Thamnidium elegans]|nr:hypothetical protein BDF21DRAFT_406392 [Thamnidium elegans]
MYQPVYGYGQQQSQSQPPKQQNYQYTQQGDTNYPTSQQQSYSPADGRANLPNFNTYGPQQAANNTPNSPAVTSTTPKVVNASIIDKDNSKPTTTSPQLSNKLKDPSLLQQQQQQQQQYNYNPIRQSPINTNSELLKSNNFPSRSYRSPITSPTQGYSNGFNSQDIVAGLTQPNYNANSVHNSPGNELPTLPPLNVSSPQLSANRQRWTPDDEKLAR